MLKPFVQNFDSLDSLWARCFFYNSLHKIGEVCRMLAWSLHSTRASPWCWPVGPSCICQWLDDTAQAQRRTCEHWEPWSCRLGRPCLFQSTSFDAERRKTRMFNQARPWRCVSSKRPFTNRLYRGSGAYLVVDGFHPDASLQRMDCKLRKIESSWESKNCAMQSGQLPTQIDVKNVALPSRETCPYNSTSQFPTFQNKFA